MSDKVGGFCPLIGADCVQDKCEWSYCPGGEHKWCGIVNIPLALGQIVEALRRV